MSDGKSGNSFKRFLRRIRSSSTLSAVEEDELGRLAHDRLPRKELPIPRSGEPVNVTELLGSQEVPCFPSSGCGLQSLGWKELPEGGPTIVAGTFASIKLAYKLSEVGKPLESRHLCIGKVQEVRKYLHEVWLEAAILRAVVHENVVDFYGMFAVQPEGQMVQEIWILLEYANAGDMQKEMERFPDSMIPEMGAKYYLFQVCAGVQYLHSKDILHTDLHIRNIVLKYDTDGTKVCMICDFGLAVIGSGVVRGVASLDHRFREDVQRIAFMAQIMMTNGEYRARKQLSADAQAVLLAGRPMEKEVDTIQKLLAYKWFHTPGQAVIPKLATPLLHRKVMHEIGYLQESGQESPTTSRSRASTMEAAAGAAGESGGEEVRAERPSWGRRIRRSLSSMGHSVSRRFNCFHRHDEDQAHDGQGHHRLQSHASN